MRYLESWMRLPCFAAIATVAACAAPDDSVSRLSDDRATRPAASAPSPARIETNDGSLAALTAEVRQLRVAVEGFARSQAETQVLGVALSAQQSRVLQLNQQLDAVRKDIDSATALSRGFEEQLPGLSSELSRVTERGQREGLESMIRAVESERNRMELQLQETRARESDLSRTLALEENRWNDLLSRMQRLTQ